MPIFEQSQAASRQAVAVRPSVAIELEWVLHSAMRPDFRVDHPGLYALYDEGRPDLLEAVRSVWPDEDTSEAAAGGWHGAFTELLLLAHHGGFLFGDDARPFLDALPELCATVPTSAHDWPLTAETEVDRRLALQRLTRLRRSPEFRRRYVDVVRSVWDAVSSKWERDGRAAVAETISAKQAMLAKGAGWREVSKGECDFGEIADRVVGALPPEGEIVVVPAYFAHCWLLYDLPGYVVLGTRAEEPIHAARERNEALSKRLRALSDPTRLAIVDSLRSRPLTVTELAQRFGLAQPTVSNHVKLLRDAGIVSEVRAGTRRNLVVRREVASVLVDDLTRVLDAAPVP
jgi:ArsR family transcriptional regulator